MSGMLNRKRMFLQLKATISLLIAYKVKTEKEQAGKQKPQL